MDKLHVSASSQTTSNRFVAAIREVTKKHIIIFNGIVIAMFALLYHVYEMVVDNEMQEGMPRYLVFFAIVLTVSLFGIVFGILYLTLSEMRTSIDKEVEDRVAEKLVCQNCVTEMFEIQKRLYNVDLENFIQTVSVDDIRKINLLVNSLSEKDDTISEDEVAKVRKFFEILFSIKERGTTPSYITMDDMRIIEGNVGNNSSIHIISSSISCDDDLKTTIIYNLKRGVRYNYYFPRNAGIKVTKDAKFKELIRQFNTNLAVWCTDPDISADTILQQVNCHWFSEEYMQMSLTFYDYQKLAQGGKPTIAVKFPATNDDVIRDFPLFFFVDSECSMNDSFCKAFSSISNRSQECKFQKNPESGLVEIILESPARKKRSNV